MFKLGSRVIDQIKRYNSRLYGSVLHYHEVENMAKMKWIMSFNVPS